MFFETDKTHYLDLASTFSGPGRHAWASVELDRNGCMFMLTVGATEQTSSRTHLFGTPTRFVAARSRIASANGKSKLASYVLVPAHLSGTGHWRLMNLNEIWMGKPQHMDEVSYRYIDPEGAAIDDGFEKYYEEDGLEVILCWDRIF